LSVLSQGQTIYGINTEVGDLARARVSDEDIELLSISLARSHACSVGEP
jgi:histidine ammonia-lyase